MKNAMKKMLMPLLIANALITTHNDIHVPKKSSEPRPQGYTHPPKERAERQHQKMKRKQLKQRKHKGHKHGGARK